MHTLAILLLLPITIIFISLSIYYLYKSDFFRFLAKKFDIKKSSNNISNQQNTPLTSCIAPSTCSQAVNLDTQETTQHAHEALTTEKIIFINNYIDGCKAAENDKEPIEDTDTTTIHPKK